MSWKGNKGTVILSGILSGIYMAYAFVNPIQDRIAVSELILQLSGSRGGLCLGCSMPELLGFMLRMFPNFVIMMLLGKNLYQYFCTASVYIFSRYPRRLSWYGRELLRLFGDICLYEILFLCSVLVVTQLRYGIVLEKAGFILGVFHMTIYILWIFGWTLLMNLGAVQFGSSSSFMVVGGAQIFLIMCLGMTDILEKVSPKAAEYFLKCNPVSYIVLGWMKSGLVSVNLEHAVFLLFGFCAVTVMAGAVMIGRQEFLMEDMEAGTM